MVHFDIDKAYCVVAALMILAALVIEIVAGPAPLVSFSLVGMAVGLLVAAVGETRRDRS